MGCVNSIIKDVEDNKKILNMYPQIPNIIEAEVHL